MSSDWLKTSLIPPDHQSQTAGKNFTQAHVIRGLNSFPSQCRPRLRLLLHMGLLTEEYGLNFGLGALAGGPLGELVQWADLMSALHVLGYEVVLSWSPKRLKNILIPNRDRGKTCQPGRTVDLVFTDINGLEQVCRHCYRVRIKRVSQREINRLLILNLKSIYWTTPPSYIT